jgi:enediyne biosynthesis protein E11
MAKTDDVYADLVAEGDYLDGFVARLDAAGWRRETPAPGWTVAHQVAHLAFIATLARTAATDPAGFAAMTATAATAGFQAAIDGALAAYLADPPDRVLARWRRERDAAAAALAAIPADATVPWLVNPLPPSVLAAAGIMELFAHGQDVLDGLGEQREYTDRIGHLVWFATRTRDFGYEARGLTPPEAPFRFELTAPSGTLWAFGPEDAEQRVTGPAVDFCLLVTRRRHRDDLAVEAVGAEAQQWLDIAQAYRGPAGQGRRPGQFAAV